MKYIIYKITIQDYVYIGSTKNFTRRKSCHKSACINQKDILVYNKINELGGWIKCIMTPIEEFECDNNIQAHIREEEMRIKYQANLNSMRCFTTEEQHKECKRIKDKKYRETHEITVKENKRIYYEANKLKISKDHKNYYETNKDKIKEYLEENKDKIRKQRKAYRESKKVSIIV